MSKIEQPDLTIYKHSPDVVIRTIAGECLLIPIRGSMANMQQIFALDAVSEFIWNRMNGTRPVTDLITAVSADFDVSPDVAGRDTIAFIRQLLDAQLITPAAVSLPTGPPLDDSTDATA